MRSAGSAPSAWTGASTSIAASSSPAPASEATSSMSHWDRLSNMGMAMRHSLPRAAETRRRGEINVFKITPRRRVSAARRTKWRFLWLVVAISAVWLSAAHAQLLDRVVARVGGVAITQSDVDAAVGLGVIEPGGDGSSPALQMIDRPLVLAEVQRFPPDTPADEAIGDLVARMKMRAGGGYEALLKRFGLDEQRVRELARDTLRIQAYIDQRFGTSAQVSQQDARDYYDRHPGEFTRNGVVAPFETVEPAARQSAATERRRADVARWLQDLRARGDVVLVTPRPSPP